MRRDEKLQTALLCSFGKIATDDRVSSDASRNYKLFVAELIRCHHGTGNEALGNSSRKGSCKGTAVDLLPCLLGMVHEIDDSGFQPGKAHIIRVVLNMRLGEDIFSVIPALGKLVNRLSAGIGQAENTGCFIKALPCRIVSCVAENTHVGIVPHIGKKRVSAGNGEAEKRGFQLGIGDVIGRHVPPDVMHRDQGDAECQCTSLGKIHAYQDGTDQAGCVGNRNRVDLLPGDAGFLQRTLGKNGNHFHMAAGCDFRDDTAVNGVQVGLRINLVRQDTAAVFHNGHGCFVTCGFKSKYFQERVLSQ